MAFKSFAPFSPKRKAAQAKGFRSGFEMDTATDLTSRGIKFEYEPQDKKIHFTQPAKARVYTPDFILTNGVIIETKGDFTSADRMKHLYIKEQHPHLDIRFVFCNCRELLVKNGRTTYAQWCRKNGFLFADRKVPQEWADEALKGYFKDAKIGPVDESKRVRPKRALKRKDNHPS